MSTAAERLAAAKSRLVEISREHADRRELRERRTREAREKSAESFSKQVATAQKMVERIEENEKLKKAAGGWDTKAATEKKGGEYRFGGEEDEPTYEASSPPGSWPPAPPAPAGDWSTPAAGTWAPTPPPPPPATPPPPPPAARPAPRRPAPVDDDEDFGSQSWLT